MQLTDHFSQGHPSQCCAIRICSVWLSIQTDLPGVIDNFITIPWANILPFSWNAGSCFAAPLEVLVDKSAVTTMTLKIWVHNENSDFMSGRKKGWWLETASYCSWDCSFFDIIASVLYRVVRLRLSISYCQWKKWSDWAKALFYIITKPIGFGSAYLLQQTQNQYLL
jgi:hypothetical protein